MITDFVNDNGYEIIHEYKMASIVFTAAINTCGRRNRSARWVIPLITKR